MLTDILLLLFLIILNGIFAMSEIAIVGSKRARLMQMASTGSVGARHALTLSSEPTRFLSSVQVGITCIGILNGAIGEASIALLFRHLSASRLVTIAQIEGRVRGAGGEFVLACDMRFARESRRFSVSSSLR